MAHMPISRNNPLKLSVIQWIAGVVKNRILSWIMIIPNVLGSIPSELIINQPSCANYIAFF